MVVFSAHTIPMEVVKMLVLNVRIDCLISPYDQPSWTHGMLHFEESQALLKVPQSVL